MSRINAFDRGARLVSEGRLLIERVDGNAIDATCRGDTGEIHRLGYRRGSWHCSCPALTQCAHLHALWRVVVGPGNPR